MLAQAPNGRAFFQSMPKKFSVCGRISLTAMIATNATVDGKVSGLDCGDS